MTRRRPGDLDSRTRHERRCDPADSHGAIEPWIDAQRQTTPFTLEEIHRHFREEFSTYGFLLEAMLESVGFEIVEATYPTAFYAEYVCRWPGASSAER